MYTIKLSRLWKFIFRNRNILQILFLLICFTVDATTDDTCLLKQICRTSKFGMDLDLIYFNSISRLINRFFYYFIYSDLACVHAIVRVCIYEWKAIFTIKVLRMKRIDKLGAVTQSALSWNQFFSALTSAYLKEN